MPWRFNPFTGNLDLVDTTAAAGSNTQVQFNDSGSLAGDADFTWNKTTNVMTVAGDVNLSDGGSFTTTLQTITPTANRTVSIPDATGTLALVAGSSGQPIYNNAGSYAGLSTATIGATGNITLSLSGASGVAPVAVTGSWFAGTTPQVLIQPSNVGTAGSWGPNGTGIGVNAISTFTGNLLDLQVNGTSNLSVSSTGTVFARSSTENIVNPASAPNGYSFNGSNGRVYIGVPASPASGIYFWADNGSKSFFYSSNQRTSITSAASFGWMGTDNNLSVDLSLFRDAADTLAQRRGTNAQTFRVYGTESSSLANYVRASLSSSSTAVTLAAESAGTGAANVPINLTAKGTGTVKVNSVAEVAVSSTVAGLPAAPAVGMLTRVTDATAPAVGVTVAGGGSAAALVWYNGTNWTVIGV